MSFDIRENLKKLPETPGVYIHKDSAGRILYVGKAINLRRRVSQYFRPPEQLDAKTRAMVSHVAEFEYITTGSEMEALILENNLIKKNEPPYNIMLKDDKTYPYIKVTVHDEWPRLVKTRRLENDGARYFGPYTDVRSVNQIIDFLGDIYALKRCSQQHFPAGFRPCLQYHIGKCAGMCRFPSAVSPASQKVSSKTVPDYEAEHTRYLESVRDVTSLLDGKNKALVAKLQSEMQAASENMEFEKAAFYRDRIQAVEAIAEKQRITLAAPSEMDIVLTAESPKRFYGIVFFVRDGKLSGRESFPLSREAIGTGKELLSAFLRSYYSDSITIPKDILVSEDLSDQSLMEDWLSDIRGSKVHIVKPQRGERRALLLLAQKDVTQMLTYLDERAQNEEEKATGCNRILRRVLELSAEKETAELNSAGTERNPYDSSPVSFGRSTADGGACETNPAYSAAHALPDRNLRIEAYDISHLGGTDTVCGMVVFTDGKPTKKAYRKFRIQSDTNGDDETALQEALMRRMRRYLNGDEGFSPLPDLLFIDGGAGQVHAVEQALVALDCEQARAAQKSHVTVSLAAIPVVGMVKDDHHRTRGLLYRDHEIDLVNEPVLFSFIGAIQEEVHRFSIEYQRSLRTSHINHSLLEEIPGIGEKRRNALLLRFGTVEAIAKLSQESDGPALLAQTPGMSPQAAAAVAAYFKEHPYRTES